MNVRKLVILFIPPVVLKVYSRIRLLLSPRKVKHNGWFNDNNDWRQAAADCSGYDSNIILTKVKSALLDVKSGRAIYERDSVLFDQKQYSEGLLTALLGIAGKYDFNLNVLDFGGSLGSTYYQNKGFLSNLKSVKWNIVEQNKFVIEGKRNFEDEVLKFHNSIDDCLGENKVNVVVFSSVLQYLENYKDIVKLITKRGIEYILLDRTPFIDDHKDKIVKQIVPETIYKASYPMWVFNQEKFLQLFLPQYELVNKFKSFCDSDYIMTDGSKITWKGFLYKRRS
jgi:putative methyltransferase (TIGR04325 family)